MTIEASGDTQIESGGKRLPLAPGAWQFLRGQVQPPSQRYYVFSKTFRPGDEPAMELYLAEWKAKGYEAEPVLRGDRYETNDGRVLDGCQYWVSLARAATHTDAQQIVKRLETLGTWAWVRVETIAPGSGTVSLRSGGQQVASIALPLTLRSANPVSVKTGSREGIFAGAIELWVEPDATLGVYETLPMEDYLAGVLPAEMPSTWPMEALEAQAVTARSDVLEHLGFKHTLEGFHFTNSEGDRVYAGHGGRLASTDAAVANTRGQVIVANGRIVPAVFSADCGGWTENNETVWSSPPNAALRGVSDLLDAPDPPGSPSNIVDWLGTRPPANCAADEKEFRWTRRVGAEQLNGLVNRQYRVGRILSIRAGERGVSGRLKSVTVKGTAGSVTIRKELPIRQAFGDLPSSMLIIKEERGPSGPVAWIFTGGGRGHGVGLCQHGARGMALKGFGHDAIVAHYFSGSTLATVR
ncbi:MAG: SpoIID/LytB domain-containing protein [Candidatus Hydrogenedentes bacterium]|nr:SpoIID/LytB domain-containing protein [Candidatus Hydrogenedentota bacterium]